MKANRLYKVGVASASKCHEPPARPTSVAAVRSYYTRFLPCLNKTWKPIIERSGKRFSSPRLIVFVGHNTPTPCGGSGDTGFYCGSNSTIYLSATVDMDDYRKFSKVWTRANMAFLIGHEYGHHVQNLTGILTASWNRQQGTSSGGAALEESRRRELQASCLSMVYLGADKSFFPVSGGIRTWLRWAVYHRGDQWNPKRDHGDKNNHGFWSMRGFNSRNASQCNTFTATHKVVS